MFRQFVAVCLLFRTFSCQDIDWNICPDGRTSSPSDARWPKIFPHHFEISTEITTDIETLEMTQSFIASYRDMTSFRNYQTNVQIYDDFQLNERLTINEESACDRSEIGSEENLPFVVSQYLKPSILLGFNGRNHYSPTFYTRYMGKEIIRGGILTKKFQTCFYIDQQKLTVNATYYLSEALPTNTAADILRIDVQSTNYPYTYNIIRYMSDPLLTISTPSGVFCPHRIDTKEFPQNLPSPLYLHAEEYTLPSDIISAKTNFYSHLIDQSLQVERIDYNIKNVSAASRLLIDYATNLTYLFISETQQCQVVSTSGHAMRTTSEILFQFDTRNNSIEYHYTGISECGRGDAQCHRWIGQSDVDDMIEQYEWYWSATSNHIDLKELIPIKLNLKTTPRKEPTQIIYQEISIFNYNPFADSIDAIDSTLGQCYRALGPSRHFNYAILQLTLNNDEKHPVHQYLLALETELHIQLANELQIRHLRLSSFIIDLTDQDIYVTFTLLDHPPGLSNPLNEPPSFELIRQLARHINDDRFHVRVDDGGFVFQARPESLRTLVLYSSSSENQTDYFNDTVFVYEDVTEAIPINRKMLGYKFIDSQTVALWTGSALLSLVITLAAGFFIAVRKWTPIIHQQRT